LSWFKQKEKMQQETLFKKDVPIHVEDRQALLTVKIDYAMKRAIDVEVTDERDPFFLYTLQLSDIDFQNLKREQGILVDFSAFPNNLIELLERCQEGKSGSSGKFQCHLNTTSSALSIVEPTAYKNLTHLTLQMKPASDATLKKYLAARLHEFKVKFIS
jgi:spindle assembly abnormal protein 6